MTLILSCRSITKSFGDLDILKGVDLDIHTGERLGLVGRNGSGKSTLANILFAALPADQGSIQTVQQEVKAVYFMQSAQCLENFIGQGLPAVLCSEERGKFLFQTSKSGLKKVREWDKQREQVLSGGEKSKIALAAVFAGEVDLLILDEPSNNLDPQGIEWLLAELKKFRGTVLVISHDRYFLDQSVERVLEIEDGKLNEYHGNYSYYRQEKQRRFQSQLNKYENQEKRRQLAENSVAQLEGWAEKAHRESREKARKTGNKMGGKEIFRAKAKKRDKAVKSKAKRLEKMLEGGVEQPQAEQQVEFSLAQTGKHGKRLIEADGIAKYFGSRCLFKDSSFYILNGEKVGIAGLNGCGKSTLIKILTGEAALERGQLFVSPSSRIALVSQDMSELEEYDQVKNAMGVMNKLEQNKCHRLLMQMGLPAGILSRPLTDMSPGEKRKLQIARAILEEPDLLILDEPLNHLDLASRETLEDALISYNGSLLLVSHDRYLLENVCQHYLYFEDENIRRIEGDLSILWECLSRPHQIKSSDNGTKVKYDAEAKLLLETRIAYLCHRITSCHPGSEEYKIIDQELSDLIRKKREMG